MIPLSADTIERVRALFPAAAEAAVTGVTVGDTTPEEVGRAAVSELSGVPSDLHGSADFRTKVEAVMVARAWQRAVEEARRG